MAQLREALREAGECRPARIFGPVAQLIGSSRNAVAFAIGIPIPCALLREGGPGAFRQVCFFELPRERGKKSGARGVERLRGRRLHAQHENGCIGLDRLQVAAAYRCLGNDRFRRQ